MKSRLWIALCILAFFSLSSALVAATSIDLSHISSKQLNNMLIQHARERLIEVSRLQDQQQRWHVRVRSELMGYKIFGADAVIHLAHNIPLQQGLQDSQTWMNGIFYTNVAADLLPLPTAQMQQQQNQFAIKTALSHYQMQTGLFTHIAVPQTERMIYIDEQQKANWIIKVTLNVKPQQPKSLPAKQIYLINANTNFIYKSWNDIKTEDGGGVGGNKKMGAIIYDGLLNHAAKLLVTRDANENLCLLKNKDVFVMSEQTGRLFTYPCADINKEHNSVYWNNEFDEVNGGYSPGNDAMFGGQMVKNLYETWFHLPVLTRPDGSPMLLTMVVHADIDNAYWDGRIMVFGDGIDIFYPLTSLGVTAHEVSHGFTEQHADLLYEGQSGGMNESFSDMAAQAAEVFVYGDKKNSWQIGAEIYKVPGEALRYLDMPSKDCRGKAPGDWCSIDDASQYRRGLDVHQSSGVYNRFFYELAHQSGWDVKKAFGVMVAANLYYWTATATFESGACGVLQAATDAGFDLDSIKSAFDVVKVNYQGCQIQHNLTNSAPAYH